MKWLVEKYVFFFFQISLCLGFSLHPPNLPLQSHVDSVRFICVLLAIALRISAWLHGVHLKNICAKFVFSTHNSSFCFHYICICIEKVALILIAWDDKIMIIILNCLVCWLFDLFSVVFCSRLILKIEWTSSTIGTKMEATSKWATHLFILWQRKAKSNTNTTRRWQ